MKKIILILLTFLIISCTTTIIKQERIDSKLVCKSYDEFVYNLSVPDPFKSYCNSTYVPGSKYKRETFQYVVNCSGSKISPDSCLMVEMERFCQDDEGLFIAISMDDDWPESVHSFINIKYLKSLEKNKI